MTPNSTRGFTLLEMSIVLTIIGFIVGGILVGRNLITASEISATITQVEKFKSATAAFQEKYGALPGDLPKSVATSFGFTARGTSAGEGDGNNLIEGITGSGNNGRAQGGGETSMFWVDLTTANGHNLNLIPGSFYTATPTSLLTSAIQGTAFGSYFPEAKLGKGNYFFVYSYNGVNYIGLSSLTNVSAGNVMYSITSITVLQAYGIDKKIDDGYPQLGVVLANYVDGNVVFGAAGSEMISGSTPAAGGIGTAATKGTAYTCYDNGNIANTNQTYSLEINGGNGPNCALSFVLQ